MKKATLFFLTVGFVYTLTAQVNSTDCNCPVKANNSGKADTIFTFSNRASIGLCGSRIKNSELYTAFVLFRCGQTNIIGEWDYFHPCQVNMKNDTLAVMQEYDLPVGQDLKLKSIPFYIREFHFNNNTLADTAYIRKDLPQYSPVQIKTVLKQYAGITPKLPDADKVTIAHRLFWAFVSGSKEAENHLISFEKKFGPFDEVSGEYFYSIQAAYQLYKKR